MVFRWPDRKIQWAVEAKWSDRFVQDFAKRKSYVRFCHSNNLTHVLVTSKKEKALKRIDEVEFEVVPASEYCYTVGYDLVMGKKACRGDENPS